LQRIPFCDKTNEEATMSDSTPQKSRWTLNEDWLSVLIAFLLILLALVGLIGPAWMKF
jgi:hypothetical protein